MFLNLKVYNPIPGSQNPKFGLMVHSSTRVLFLIITHVYKSMFEKVEAQREALDLPMR